MINDAEWAQVRALDGHELQTVRDKRPFTIRDAMADYIKVMVGSGRSYQVRRLDFDNVLGLHLPIERLGPSEAKRLLGQRGIQISCASYVVAILRHLRTH